MSTDWQNLENMAQRLSRHAWLPPDLRHVALEVSRLQMDVLASAPFSSPSCLPDMAALPRVVEALASAQAHSQGQSLLHPQYFPYDAPAATALWEALLALAEAMPQPMGASALALRLHMNKDNDALTAVATFDALLQGDEDFFAHWASRMPEAPAMPRFLATAALTPWLTVASAALATWHKADTVWEYGSCPHCGHQPLLGQLRGKEGFRWHVCSFCRLEYRVPRLQCPLCLEKNPGQLRYFVLAEEEGHEVHVCESCKNYIKLRDMRESQEGTAPPLVAQDSPRAAQMLGERGVLMALEDLDSLPLDLAARQQGYVRSTLSAWGF